MPTLSSNTESRLRMNAFCAICVSAMALFSFAFPAISDIAAGFLVLAGLGFFVHKPKEMMSVPLLSGLAWIGLVLISACYVTAADLPGKHFASLGKHLPIALGPLAGIAISRSTLSKNVVLVIFGISFIAGGLVVLLTNGAMDFFLNEWRHSDNHSFIGRLNRNFAAFVCGASIILAATLMSHAIHKRLAVGALALFIVYESAILVSLQSRTAYAATTLALLTWAGIHRRTSWKLPLVIIGLIAAVAASKTDSIVDRLTFHGSRQEILLVGIDLIWQRPWFGWGPDVSHLLKLFSSSPDIQGLTQFHNGYLQLIISFGVAGASIMLCLLLSLVWTALQDSRKTKLSPPLFAGAMALLVYVSVTNLTESIIFVKPAAMICLMLSALCTINARSCCPA